CGPHALFYSFVLLAFWVFGDQAACLPVGLLFGADAQRIQNVLCVLAQMGGQAVDATRRAAQLGNNAGDFKRRAIRQIAVKQYVAGLIVGVGCNISDVVNTACWNASLVKNLQYLVQFQGAGPVTDSGIDDTCIPCATIVVSIVGIFCHIGAANGAHQTLENAVAISCNQGIFTIFTYIGIAGGDAGQAAACRFAYGLKR